MATKLPSVFKERVLVFAALAGLVPGLIQPGLGQDRPATPATQPLNINQYTAELDRWKISVGRLEDHPEEAGRLRRDLPKLWPVEVDGQRFEVSTDWLRSALESLEKGPKECAASVRTVQWRLLAMRREAEELGQTRAQDAVEDGHARQALTEILARREFQDVHGPTWWDRAKERFYRWVADLFDRFGWRLASYPAITRVVFWSLLVLGAGALLVWMVRRLLRPAATVRLGLGAPASPASSWQQMAQDARRAAARGDYREAIGLTYWAGIVRLEELGLWKLDRTRTHREYLRLLAPAQPQWKVLAAVTRQFEFAWYARRPSSEEDFKAAMVHLEELGCAFPSTRAIERF